MSIRSSAPPPDRSRTTEPDGPDANGRTRRSPGSVPAPAAARESLRADRCNSVSAVTLRWRSRNESPPSLVARRRPQHQEGSRSSLRVRSPRRGGESLRSATLAASASAPYNENGREDLGHDWY